MKKTSAAALLLALFTVCCAADDSSVQTCVSDLNAMFNISDPVHEKMLDAWGHFPPSGLLGGNLQVYGAYWECSSLGLDVARFCKLSNDAFPNSKVRIHAENALLPTPVNTDIPILIMSLGVCVPASCNADNLVIALNMSYGGIQVSVVDGSVSAQCESERVMSAGARTVIGILATFGVVGVICSFVQEFWRFQKQVEKERVGDKKKKEDLHAEEGPLLGGGEGENTGDAEKKGDQGETGNKKKKEKKTPLQTFVEIFAASDNLRKLFTIKGGDPELDKLKALDGVRVLSLLWVILGHCYLMYLLTGAQNILALADEMKRFCFLFVLNAYFSVDTFFFLSGFLAFLLLYWELNKGVQLTPLRILFVYLHRLWRITPTYFLVVMFLTFVLKYTGSGPAWDGVMQLTSVCETGWWRDILYINNFWPMSQDCIGWAWYLANDMQFFLLAPLLTLLVFKRPKIGALVIGLLWLGSFIYALTLSLHYKYPALSFSGEAGDGQDDWHSQSTLIYIKPWARIQPYLIGMVAAYFHIKHGAEISARKYAGFAALLASAAVLYGCVFMVHAEQIGHDWSTAGNSFYIALSRSVWGVGMAVVILVCCNGAGGVINDFLSAGFWTPMARIGLSAYLIHFMFVLWVAGGPKVLFYFDDNNVIMLFFGVTMMTYGFGFLLGAFVEEPMRNLGKLFIKG